MFRLQSAAPIVLLTTCLFNPMTASAAPADPGVADTLKAQYRLTKVGMVLLSPDYNRITQPGSVLTVRIPGIYADMANTKQAVVQTIVQDGKASQQKGFLAALSRTNASRELSPSETVYVTRLDVRADTIRMELLTTNVVVLGGGESTRYRAELNIKVPGLSGMSAEDAKKQIEVIIADGAVANAVESKTIKLGMGTDEVRKTLGNPDKIVDLGAKQVYVYKDMKVVFNDAKVTDVQ